MSKLEKKDGEIVLASNNAPAVYLDTNADGSQSLRVLLPEGISLTVIPTDSGLRLISGNDESDKVCAVRAVRTSPKPELRRLEPPTQFTCPRCGSHRFGSSACDDGTLERFCHGCLKFRFNSRDDGLYFKEVPE